MRHRFISVLLLAACGGGTLYSAFDGTPAAAPVDAFECAKAQFKTLDYQQTSNDVVSHRLTARHIDDNVHRPDSQFRRLVDHLIVEISAGSDGRTAMHVEAHTFAESMTVRGPTEAEEGASAGAKAAAEALLKACTS